MGQLTTVKNASLESAKEQLANAKKAYENAGTTFVTSLESAIADMEGDTKDAITEFIKNTISPFVKESVPQAIDGCFQLLEGNRNAFEQMDLELANALREQE